MLKFCNQRNRWGHNHEWKGFGGSHMEGGRSEPYLRHRHGGSGGGFGGRGEGKRRFFERGEFKFALLELLSEAPMHGYQLIKAMEEKTGGLYSRVRVPFTLICSCLKKWSLSYRARKMAKSCIILRIRVASIFRREEPGRYRKRIVGIGKAATGQLRSAM